LRRKTKGLENLKPEDKVKMAIEMSDMCMQVCAAGVLMQNPGISDKDLLGELRKRVEWVKKRRGRQGV